MNRRACLSLLLATVATAACAESASAAPDTVIDAHPDALETRDSSASFSFSGVGDVASFECSLDSEPFAECTSPADYVQLAVGSHEFRVRAVDSVGDEDPSPASFEWQIATDCHGREATMIASPGLPTVGTAGRDVIVGTNGADEIEGAGGNDFLCGAKGSDEIHGGSGKDGLLGATGNDDLFGEGGRDDLKGGKGRDSCSGGAGRDSKSACES
jgi:Ca2+-binding RTX toxin-like protein